MRWWALLLFSIVPCILIISKADFPCTWVLFRVGVFFFSFFFSGSILLLICLALVFVHVSPAHPVGRVYVCTNIISAMHTILVRNFYIHFGLIFTKRMNEWLMYIFCYLNGCAMNIPNDRLVLIRADIQMHRQQIGVCIQHQIPTLPF